MLFDKDKGITFIFLTYISQIVVEMVKIVCRNSFIMNGEELLSVNNELFVW